MDPNLWELYLEGDAADEVMAILRLHDERKLPPDVRVIAQFGSIATCRLLRGDILRVRALPEIASLKAPDPIVADAFDDGAAEVAIDPSDVRRPEVPERGRGTVVAVVDWGLDFAHPNFRNLDGTTRLLALWDQQGDSGSTPNRYGYGRIHDRREIDDALRADKPYATLDYDVAAFDAALTGTHGTHVTDIAAGNGTVGPSGIAPEADLVFVHLSARTGGFSSLGDSVTLLEAIDFIRSVAGDRPCVINLSMGNMGGPHDGTTLVEQAIDAAVQAKPGFAICQSCGNYYQRRAHAMRQIAAGEVTSLRWQTDPGDRTPNELEIWYSRSDRFAIRVIAPDGSASPSIALGEHSDFEIDGKRAARIYHRESDPNNRDHHVHIFLYTGATAGIWTIEVTGEQVTDGRFHAWIERDESCSRCQSQFAVEDASAGTTTGTICNGSHTIAVAAYDARADVFALGAFSSVGPTRDGRNKPDLCAPGVRVLAARSYVPDDDTALLTRKSGTSMASPHVAGTVALLFDAARRPLPIAETRRLLISTADATGIPPELATRAGAGRLNIEAALAAARQIAEENAMTMTIESEPELSEEVAARVSAGGVQSAIDTSVASGFSATTLDEALQGALSNLAAQPNWAILGNIVTAGYEAMTWTPSASLPAPAVIEVDTTTVCCVIIGGAVYIPSSVSGAVLRWVQIPRVAEFYALAPPDQTAQRSRWKGAVWKARTQIAAALPGTTVTKSWLETLSMPALRLLLAQFAEHTLPVKNIDNSKDQRGGLVNGVTNPILLFPLVEPDCYLRVIAGAEGMMESINTWDLGAGVSLGPIQFNAIGGHLFDFAGRLNDLDPTLFAQELGALGWSVSAHSGHVDVSIAATPPVVMHGDATHVADNAGFLQSGVVGNGKFNQIDAAVRRRLAARFRNVVAWPHVQELIYRGSADYLAAGLVAIADPANGIPAFDPAAPDRDLFILKAMLLSAFVRFSACLDPLLVALRRWTTVADKLKHILDAVDAMGTKTCIKRRASLHTRLAGQLAAGTAVWKVIRKLRRDTSPESLFGEWEPNAEWDESDEADELPLLESWREDVESDESDGSNDAQPHPEDFEDWSELTVCGESDESADEADLAPDAVFARLSSWSSAELFDAFYGGGTAARAKFLPLVEVVAAPGEPMPDLSAGHVLVTRALGEGNVARLSVVSRSMETAHSGVWSEAIESAGGGVVARQFADSAGRVPANRIVFRVRGAEEDPPASSATGLVAIDCGGGVSLHADLVAAAAETRRLASETLPLVRPPCAATTLCPTVHRGFHATGDATHFGNLSTDMIRIAEIAGIWGTDLSSLRTRVKPSQQVTMPNPYAPLGSFGAVAIRRNSKRELHLHRGSPVVESWVDGARWQNLAVQHALGLVYTLMKRRWFERSIHRQWGTEAAIAWLGFLCRFYKDQTGLALGIGDISHIVGETMTDHGSHRRGLDVDVYVLEYPGGTPFPEAYWCDGAGPFSLSSMAAPARVGPAAEYTGGVGTALGAREVAIWQRYATVLAFCLGTWSNIDAFVWHGARQLESDAVTLAGTVAAAWNPYWGPAPSAVPTRRVAKLVGVGHSSYGATSGGWPVHHDHMHIRLKF